MTPLKQWLTKKVYDDTYYRTAYDVSKGIGGTPSSFSTLDTKTVDRVLNAKFQGKNFSERIWGNTDILAKQLKEKLAVAIATGQSLDKTSRDIRERFWRVQILCWPTNPYRV